MDHKIVTFFMLGKVEVGCFGYDRSVDKIKEIISTILEQDFNSSYIENELSKLKRCNNESFYDFNQLTHLVLSLMKIVSQVIINLDRNLKMGYNSIQLILSSYPELTHIKIGRPLIDEHAKNLYNDMLSMKSLIETGDVEKVKKTFIPIAEKILSVYKEIEESFNQILDEIKLLDSSVRYESDDDDNDDSDSYGDGDICV